MKLGDAAQITIRTPKLKEERAFFDKIGFQIVRDDDEGLLLTDGTTLFELIQDTNKGAELTYFTKDLQKTVAQAEDVGITFDETGEALATLRDPSKVHIHLIQRDAATLPDLPDEPVSEAGRFGEVSIETKDLRASIRFWKRLGFEVEHRDPPVSQWATIFDGVLRIGLYEHGVIRHKFRNPSITYFEPDMAERIARLRDKDLHIAQELPEDAEPEDVKSAIAEAPSGVYFFLFSF